MTITHLVPRPRGVPVAAGWETRGRCSAARIDGLDLAELTSDVEDTLVLGTYEVVVKDPAGERLVTRDFGDDIEAARNMCRGCPVLDVCRDRALTQDNIAGVAGGLDERERQAWRSLLGITAETLRLAVLVRRHVPVTVNGHPTIAYRLVLDLSTETRATTQRKEITAEELVVIARLTAEGWTTDQVAAELVTVRACGDGSETVEWSPHRVAYAQALLSGSRGTTDRRPA